jgi:hypothetical protein
LAAITIMLARLINAITTRCFGRSMSEPADGIAPTVHSAFIAVRTAKVLHMVRAMTQVVFRLNAVRIRNATMPAHMHRGRGVKV